MGCELGLCRVAWGVCGLPGLAFVLDGGRISEAGQSALGSPEHPPKPVVGCARSRVVEPLMWQSQWSGPGRQPPGVLSDAGSRSEAGLRVCILNPRPGHVTLLVGSTHFGGFRAIRRWERWGSLLPCHTPHPSSVHRVPRVCQALGWATGDAVTNTAQSLLHGF